MADQKEKRSVGFIEAIGLASAIEAADTAVKAANVTLLGYEYSGYDARIVVKIEGKIGDVKAAIAAASAATHKVQGSLSGYQSVLSKGALDGSVYHTLVRNAQTIGDELQVKSGKRPQGTSRKGKRVGRWNPVGAYITE
ncbi:MAG: BMC domain-containing protein [Eubacteriales bacterium]|nr:BMC domain-containing protein [Eubacteriales bacterium]